MGNVNQSTVTELVLMEENAEFGTIPAGKFAKQKFFLSLSLIIDMIFLAGIIFNIVHLQMNASFWSISVSAAHICSLFMVFSMFVATVYAVFGLVTMSLTKFVFAVFSWVLTIVSVFLMVVTMFISLLLSFRTIHPGDSFYLQTSTCVFFRTDSYCDLTRFEYFFVIALISASLLTFKSGQIILLRSLCVESHDYLDRKSQSTNRQSKSNDQSDSDDDDVVVFERISGRYPGGSSIKDKSIA